MFRATSKPFVPPRAVQLSHKEWVSTDNGVEQINVNDCRYLCDPEDFDLEVQIRSGENLKEVPTCLSRGGVDINVESKDEVNNNE